MASNIYIVSGGKKVAEGDGEVERTDRQADTLDSLKLREKAVIPELHFKVHIPRGHWYRLRRSVMGGKPRIPRKIKKAITHPCVKSKWLAKSKFFNNRLWGRYCERTMQPGQCHTLQARLLLYLTITGCKYSWRGQTLKCEMPSGVRLAIFPKPKYYASIGEHKFSLYGVALYPNRKYGRIRYLDEKNAMYLYKRLGEKIKEKAVQL